MTLDETPNKLSEVERLRRLANFLDSSIPLPGGYRIGFDGLIGLVPVIGDAAGAALSTYIVIQAARLGASTAVLVRMMLNIVLEAGVGVIPVLGDLFDFAWKANNRNMDLLDAQVPRDSVQGSARRRIALAAVIVVLLFCAVLILLMVFAVRILIALFAALGA